MKGILMKHTCLILLLVLLILTLCTMQAATAREDYAAIVEQDCESCHIESYYPGGDFFEAEDNYKWKLFWVSTAIAVFIFLTGMINNVMIWRAGKAPSLKEKIHWGSVAKAILSEVILEKRIFKTSFIRWSVFFGISMGFILLLLAFTAFISLKLSVGLDYLEPTTLQLLLDSTLDFFGFLIFISCMMAIVRRYVLKSAQMENLIQDSIAVLFILLIILSGFILEGFRCATLPISSDLHFSFIGNFIGSFLKPFELPWTVYHFYLWIIHGLLSLAFVAYIPFGKIRHFIACPISIAATASDEAHTETG